MRKKNLIIFFVCIMLVFSIYIPKKSAELIAVRYMEILTIHDDVSFKKVKSRIYNISPDYVKNTLFQHDKYPLTPRLQSFYEIHSVSSDFVALGHYIVYVDYTVDGYFRLTSAFKVVDGVVEDTYRFSK